MGDKPLWKTIVFCQFVFILYFMFLNKSQENCKPPDTSNSPVMKTIENLPQCEPCPIERGGKINLINSNLTKTGGKDKSGKRRSSFNPKDLKMVQAQTHIELVQEIQNKWLQPPSEKPYNFTKDTNTNLSAVKKLHAFVLKLLKGKKRGFFVECGGFDGVWLSNTLHLEQEYNWTGLLVEADPSYYKRLVQKQRKVWTINACLSITPNKTKAKLTRVKNLEARTRISEIADKAFRGKKQAEEFEAQCFPLASILAAIGQTTNIDYFSLDIEGAELRVLKTIPWEFVYIKVLSLEANPRTIPAIAAFLSAKNYKLVKYIRGPWIHDYVFLHQ